jgi:hypothetical protein
VSPIILVDGNEAITITGNDIRTSFLLPLYKPIPLFRIYAEVLASAMEGNYTGLLRSIANPRLQDACVIDNSTIPPGDGQHSIACTDGEDTTGHDLEFFEKYIDKLKTQSPTFGAMWATLRFICGGWRIRPKWRFTGPFTSPPADPSLKEGVPAAPMLLLSSRLDPVTPLANAYLMSAGHPGSAVVMQDSVGHCALPTGWSECTNEILREYFDTGKVPKNGTVCHTGCKPWVNEDCGMLAAKDVDQERLPASRWPFRPPVF